MATNATFHLLLVDDDPLIADSLKLILPPHWRLTAVRDAKLLDARMMIHAAFVDMHLTAGAKAEGPAVIETLSAHNPNTEIIAISGDLSMELMELCLKNGAKKFLAKPLHPDEVVSTLEKIEALWGLRQMEKRTRGTGALWIGDSPGSQAVKKTIASLRGESGPILIQGETGTGKEVAFRLLNEQEPNRPAIVVNVAGLSDNLFESEMFGHVRGAFTGADSNKVGLAEAAHGGDLFLDEIEALSLASQVKLLRFLETGEVRKVGGKDVLHVQARVIVASNQNLQDLVRQGKFREDLLFRISGKIIKLPPLRERTSDIATLVQYFFEHQRPRRNKMLSPEALARLEIYSWPGNVRELKRVCEQLALTAQLPIIREGDVSALVGGHVSAGQRSYDLTTGLDQLVAEFEGQVISQALQASPDVDSAAQLLKISRSNLYKKIKDYGIQTP